MANSVSVWLLLALLHVNSCTEQITPNSESNDDEITSSSAFSYGYKINNPKGHQHGHQVTVDGQRSKGKYYVKLADGTDQYVQYYADRDGYRPRVRYVTGNINYQTDIESRDTAKIAVYKNSPTPTEDDSTLITTRYNSSEVTTEPTTTTTEPDVVYYTARQNPLEQKLNDEIDKTPVEGVLDSDFETRIMFLNDADIRKIIKNVRQPNSEQAMEVELKKLNFTDLFRSSEEPNSSPSDFYNPETNEISNSFVKKIVSVIPELYAEKPSKFFHRPIVVMGNFSSSDEEKENTLGEQQSASDIVQVQQHSSTTTTTTIDDRQTESEVTTKVDVKKNRSEESNDDTDDGEKSKKNTISNQYQSPTEIEQQFLREQAVYTTTVEIQKSLPLNFIGDNRLTNENGINNNNNHNNYHHHHSTDLQQSPIIDDPKLVAIAAAGVSPQIGNIFVNSAPPIAFAGQTSQLSSGITLFPPYVPLPLQFGFSPEDDYLRDRRKITPITTANSLLRQIDDKQRKNNGHLLDDKEDLPTVSNVINQDETNSISSINSVRREQPNRFVYGATTGYRDEIYPTYYTIDFIPQHSMHVMPVARQQFADPLAYRLHSYTTGHTYSNDAKSAVNSPPLISPVQTNKDSAPKIRLPSPYPAAPFRPSYPIWDSIYPPQHTYYVPLIVPAAAGKLDERQSRKYKEVDNRRRSHSGNQQRLHRLLIEYGGFKPPMIPSTLVSNSEEEQQELEARRA